MADVKRKVNFHQADHHENQNHNKQTNRKRTIYEINQDKLNLVEVRRKINKQQIRFDQNQKHIKELYNLDKTRRKVKEELKKQQDQEEDEKLNKLDFKPKIDGNSKKLAQKKVSEHPDIVERQ